MGVYGMQAHADRSTTHFHVRQSKLIPGETTDFLDVLSSKLLGPNTLMF